MFLSVNQNTAPTPTATQEKPKTFYKLTIDEVEMFPTKSVIKLYLYLGIKSLNAYKGGFKGDLNRVKKYFDLDWVDDNTIDTILDELVEAKLLTVTNAGEGKLIFNVN